MTDELEYFSNKRTDRLYVSGAFPDSAAIEAGTSPPESSRLIRILSKVLDSDEVHEFVKISKDVVLRITEGRRQEVRAIFYDDSRQIKSLTIQRFTAKDGKPNKHSFTFRGDEIEQLFNLLRVIRSIDFASEEKTQIDASILNDGQLSKDEKRQLLLDDPDLVAEIAQNHISSSDIVALAYRRKQLDVFERLISDDDYFQKTKTDWGVGRDEDVWQRFFEKNTWIFGYGLNYIFTSSLDEKKLEQVTSGYSVNSPGKRVDALMKTRGIIGSLCFAEIKTHKTPLLHTKTPYRSGSWRISDDLAGGVAQVHKTVQQAMEDIRTRFDVQDKYGNPTGELLFLYQPRSFLVIGNLREFVSDKGINEQQFGSFELFRRNLSNPEIITFDELFERAKYIVQHHDEITARLNNSGKGEVEITPECSDDEDIPF